VVDGNGNGTSVWGEFNAGIQYAYSSRYDSGTDSWSAAEQIHANGSSSDSAAPTSLGLDASGNVISVGFDYDGVKTDLWANRYDAAAGTWGASELLETDDVNSADFDSLAVSASGKAIVVWQQISGGRDSIWANRYQ
jgi:hypothetical protein